VTKRKVVKKFGGLIAQDAQLKMDIIQRKEDEAKAKRQRKAIEKIARDEAKDMYCKRVIARKEERERKKKVKELQAAKQEVPPILLVSIPDPKKTWLAVQEEMKLL